jgi:hypothetical protein
MLSLECILDLELHKWNNILNKNQYDCDTVRKFLQKVLSHNTCTIGPFQGVLLQIMHFYYMQEKRLNLFFISDGKKLRMSFVTAVSQRPEGTTFECSLENYISNLAG